MAKKLRKRSPGLFREALKCHLVRLDYDFLARAGCAWFPAGECCDMTGCLELFESIDPQVLIVRTFSGEARDTVYGRQWDPKTGLFGEWETLYFGPG